MFHCNALLKVRSNRTASGWAVVKTWCVPVLKVKQRGYAPCSPKKAYTQVKLLLAQQQVGVSRGVRLGGGSALYLRWVDHVLRKTRAGEYGSHCEYIDTEHSLLQISRECGFNEIVPKLWIEPVSTHFLESHMLIRNNAGL